MKKSHGGIRFAALLLTLTMLLGLLTVGALAAEESGAPFNATVNGAALEVAYTFEDGYTPYVYDAASGEMVPGDAVTVYVVVVPAGVNEVEVSFPENVLAYNYKDGATYLAGYYEDAFTGVDTASVPVDANKDGIADFIQIQSPYDAETWATENLYAIVFICTDFAAGVEGGALIDVTVTEDGYTPYVYDAASGEMVPGDAVTVYVVVVPAGVNEVEVSFPENVLAYNYKDGATYLSGYYEDPYTGADSATVPVDVNNDGVSDYIQVQSPYDPETWATENLYAINFKVESSFTDVAFGEYYYYPVEWAYANGVTTGATDTTFNPAGSCTREQFVTFLWRAEGKPSVSDVENPFKDVVEGEYYYDAVLWAYSNGITTGMSEDSFGVGSTVTREQAVTFLWRAADEPSAESESSFSDVAEGAYYYDAVTWALANEITNGMGDGSFGVGASCIRAQVVTFLARFCAE